MSDLGLDDRRVTGAGITLVGQARMRCAMIDGLPGHRTRLTVIQVVRNKEKSRKGAVYTPVPEQFSAGF